MFGVFYPPPVQTNLCPPPTAVPGELCVIFPGGPRLPCQAVQNCEPSLTWHLTSCRTPDTWRRCQVSLTLPDLTEDLWLTTRSPVSHHRITPYLAVFTHEIGKRWEKVASALHTSYRSVKQDEFSRRIFPTSSHHCFSSPDCGDITSSRVRLEIRTISGLPHQSRRSCKYLFSNCFVSETLGMSR